MGIARPGANRPHASPATKLVIRFSADATVRAATLSGAGAAAPVRIPGNARPVQEIVADAARRAGDAFDRGAAAGALARLRRGDANAGEDVGADAARRTGGAPSREGAGAKAVGDRGAALLGRGPPAARLRGR